METVKNPVKVEFSREETEKFTSLIEDITPNYYRLKEDFFSKKNFLFRWQDAQGYQGGAENLFNLREKWLQIKKEGEKFEKYMEELMLSKLDEKRGIYEMLSVYLSLNPGGRIPFFTKLLSHEQIWNNKDSSSCRVILTNLIKYGGQCESTAIALQQYIENIYSVKYRRGAFRETDIYGVSDALIAVAGKERALFLLSGLSRKIPAFASWIKKNENKLFADEIKPPIIIEPFDLSTEKEISEQLAQQLKNIKINGPNIQDETDFQDEDDLFSYLGEDDMYDRVSYEQKHQDKDAGKNESQPLFHYHEIKDSKVPVEIILEKLKPKIEAGEYGQIFGDDASGRVPALLINKIIRGLYDKYGYKHPAVYFLTGSRYLYDSEKEEKTALIREHLDHISMTERPDDTSGRALIVTDTIATGMSLEPLIDALKEKGVDFDIVSIGDCSSEDLSEKWGKNVYYGMERTPDIYPQKHLGGVIKDAHNLFSSPIKTDKKGQQKINEAREDISLLANEILTEMNG